MHNVIAMMGLHMAFEALRQMHDDDCRYNGADEHPLRDQEIPAVFFNRALGNLVFYAGEAPWTGGQLERVQPGEGNKYYKPTEQVGVDEAEGTKKHTLTTYKCRGKSTNGHSWVMQLFNVNRGHHRSARCFCPPRGTNGFMAELQVVSGQ